MSGLNLYFLSAPEKVGFTQPGLSSEDGSPEPIIRELIQNSVDATLGRRCEVTFEISEVPSTHILGLTKYVRAFNAACAELEEPLTPDTRRITQRIRNMLRKDRVPVLFCTDNGKGLTPKSMNSVLTTGNSNKGAGGAGSFGLGHYAPFSASDLRYVMYASQYLNGSGALQSIVSGQAILATRRNSNEGLLSANGYLCAKRPVAIGNETSHFATQIPLFLRSKLTPRQPGTTVAMVGFNSFNLDDPYHTQTANEITKAAAINFAAAITQDNLVVKIRTPTSDKSVDRTNIEHVLASVRDKRQASKKGHLSGYYAYRLHRTRVAGALLDSSKYELAREADVYFRELADRAAPTRIHIARSGMWITSNHVPRYKFSECHPFDALICPKHGTQFERLVREAEPPEHLGLDQKRLEPNDRATLRRYFSDIVELLKNHAGKTSDDKQTVIPGFAVIEGKTMHPKRLQPKPRIMPLPTPTPDEDPPQETLVPLVTDPSGSSHSKPSDTHPQKVPPSLKPRPGRLVKHAISFQVTEPTPDTPQVIDMDFALKEQPAMVGISVSVRAGFDETSGKHEGSEWATRFVALNTSDITVDTNDPLIVGETGDKEATIKLREGRHHLRIPLAERISNPNLLQIQAVARQAVQTELAL